MKRKVHYLKVRVSFDKPCSAHEAAAMFKDCVWGYYYPSLARENAPELMKLTGATPTGLGPRKPSRGRL